MASLQDEKYLFTYFICTPKMLLRGIWKEIGKEGKYYSWEKSRISDHKHLKSQEAIGKFYIFSFLSEVSIMLVYHQVNW